MSVIDIKLKNNSFKAIQFTRDNFDEVNKFIGNPYYGQAYYHPIIKSPVVEIIDSFDFQDITTYASKGAWIVYSPLRWKRSDRDNPFYIIPEEIYEEYFDRKGSYNNLDKSLLSYSQKKVIAILKNVLGPVKFKELNFDVIGNEYSGNQNDYLLISSFVDRTSNELYSYRPYCAVFPDIEHIGIFSTSEQKKMYGEDSFDDTLINDLNLPLKLKRLFTKERVDSL